MPRLDGFEATRLIMETHPLPIVICTATADPQELAIVFRSMEAGALACVRKPSSAAESRADAQNLLQTIRLMSEVKVGTTLAPDARRLLPALTSTSGRYPRLGATNRRIVGIGASTGGPPVLQRILSALPKSFPCADSDRSAHRARLSAGHGGLAQSEHSVAGSDRRSRNAPRCRVTSISRPMTFISALNGSRRHRARARPARERASARRFVAVPIVRRTLRPLSDRRAAHRHGQRRRRRAETPARPGRRHHRAGPRELHRSRHAGRGHCTRRGHAHLPAGSNRSGPDRRAEPTSHRSREMQNYDTPRRDRRATSSSPKTVPLRHSG